MVKEEIVPSHSNRDKGSDTWKTQNNVRNALIPHVTAQQLQEIIAANNVVMHPLVKRIAGAVIRIVANSCLSKQRI
jgi:hypothetical protein